MRCAPPPPGAPGAVGSEAYPNDDVVLGPQVRSRGSVPPEPSTPEMPSPGPSAICCRKTPPGTEPGAWPAGLRAISRVRNPPLLPPVPPSPETLEVAVTTGARRPRHHDRYLPDQRHRLHRVLRRQRQAGEPLYRSAFGFQLVGYRGPETGVRDRASYLLQQDKIRFVLTTADRDPTAPIAEHVHKHGDGVRDIALWVDDARDAYAKGRRARRDAGAGAARCCEDDDGEVVIAAISTYGDTIHSLVERRNYTRPVPARASCRSQPRYPAASRSASSTSTTASATSSSGR